jgi:phosphatidylserine decarboxylase
VSTPAFRLRERNVTHHAGSIVTTAEEGQTVKRGDEFGYFKFGGSTIVTLFERGVVDWDEDLRVNGRAALETLVRVGMRMGKRRA